MRKNRLHKLVKNEKGQTLIIVVLLMLVAALVIAPMLSHVSSGLKSGVEVFEEKMYGQYAADSGVEDALYRIQLSDPNMPDEWDGPWVDDDAYNAEYAYSLTDPVNGNNVDVTIRPQWVLEGLEEPPSGMTPHAGMVVVGDTVGEEDGNGLFQISINITEDSKTLHVETVGAWLPGDFTYVEDSGNLGDDPGAPYYMENPEITPHRGGTAVVWHWSSNRPKFEELPGEEFKKVVTFQFTPQGTPVSAFSWVRIQSEDISLSWDVDLKFYQIESVATDADTGETVTVEAYAAENEMRLMGEALSGDYCAVGNTLMEATSNDYYRSRLFRESSADVTNITLAQIESQGGVPPGSIPENASVDAAYLYWSGWIEGEAGGAVAFNDPCNNFDNWDDASSWTIYPLYGPGDKEFQGRGDGSDASRTLDMLIDGNPPFFNLDLSPYSGREVTVSWSQRTWGGLNAADKFYYRLSADGGSNWDDFLVFKGSNPDSNFSAPIPEEYLTSDFRLGFFADFNRDSEYVYIDDILISATSGSSIEDAKINRVVFNGHQITANLDDCQVEATPDSGAPDSWCYSCYYEATDLVKQLIDDGDVASNGAGTYTLGHWTEGNGYGLYPSGSTDYPLGTPALNTSSLEYQWSYAGWSLIVVYSSPDTEGHQLYLFDDPFRYVAVHTTLEFPISGFLVPTQIAGEEIAAHMTCFVGDGDERYSGDYIALRDQDDSEHKLSDGVNIGPIYAFWGSQWFSNPYDNVWNGKFKGPDGSVVDGIDIDTFEVSWASGALEPGDSSADIVLGNASTAPGDAELIMVVYVIVSFRSDVTSGGTLSYLIRG